MINGGEFYNSEAARAHREAVRDVKTIIREFGDPNNGDYIDPLYEPAINIPMQPGVEIMVPSVEERVAPDTFRLNMAAVEADMAAIVARNNGGRTDA